MAGRSIYDLRTEDTPGAVIYTSGWTIKRAPINGSLHLDCLSSVWVGCRTHWANGRTQPCLSTDCPWHAQGVPATWHGYIAGQESRTKERILFEFTDSAAARFIEAKARYGSLYGVKVSASRASQKPNGRVVIGFGGKHPDPSSLPSEVAILPILARIWRLDDDGCAGSLAGPGGSGGDSPASILPINQELTQTEEQRIAAELHRRADKLQAGG